MATKPSVFPQFAILDLNNGTAGAPNVVEPSSGKKDSGWNEGERPPRETFNWLARITNDWIEYFEDVLDDGTSSHFSEDKSTTSGLNFAVGPGLSTVGGDEKEIVANTIVALTDNATTFIWYNSLTNTILSADEAGTVPELLGGVNIVPLFRVTAVAGVITVTDDLRTWMIISEAEGRDSLQESWNFDTATAAADPGPRLVRFDNATPASITEIYFDDVSNGGVDVGTWLSRFVIGDKIYMSQLNDASRYVVFQLNAAPTDSTGFWTIEVDIVDSGTLPQSEELLSFVRIPTETIVGEFTGTLTGCTTSPTATFDYVIRDGIVHLFLEEALVAVSNTTAMTVTGLPAIIQNGIRGVVPCQVQDNNTQKVGMLSLLVGTMQFRAPDASSVQALGNFTNSNNKGLADGWNVSYALALP